MFLHGREHLTNTFADKEFSFFPQSFYPTMYEVYMNINTGLASMIERSHQANNNEIIIELDGGNGLLAYLCKDLCTKYYFVQHYRSNEISAVKNFKTHGLDDKVRMSFNATRISHIVGQIGDDARITLVFQELGIKKSPFDRKKSEWRRNYLIILYGKVTFLYEM